MNAAAALVVRDGAGSLTLDRVAREAGVSKGGLLYHFAGKERLIQALIERMIAQFDADLAAHQERDPHSGPGRRTRAFVRATLEGSWDRDAGLRPDGAKMFAALLAAVATDPALLAPLRRRYAKWQSELEHDDITPARATVVRLAADGLWFAERLGLASFEPRRRKQIIGELLRLTEECEKHRTPGSRAKRTSA